MKTCANPECGNTWEMTTTTSPKKRFCSLRCRRKFEWAAELARRGKGNIIRFCAFCAKEFTPKPNQIVCESPRCRLLNYKLTRLVASYKRSRRTNVQKYSIRTCLRCRSLFKGQTPNQSLCAPCAREVTPLTTYQCQVKWQAERGLPTLAPHFFVKCETCSAPVPYRRVRYCSPECGEAAERSAEARARASTSQTHNLFQVLAISSTLTKTQTKNEC